MNLSKKLFVGGIISLTAINFFLLIPASQIICQESFFTKSLHYTTEGMRYWYEEQGGFMNVTGIPYAELDCKSCHIGSCDQCHDDKTDNMFSYSVASAKKQEVCLACHSREGATINLGKQNNMLDVHFANDMVCTDCHKVQDSHGDGNSYISMRDIANPRPVCTDCHEADSTLRAHTVHKGKLDCNACHVKYTTTCMNCHFDQFLATGSRKGTFIALPANVFLINYNGKVTTANLQTLVYKGDKFVAYAPYYTHSIQAKARQCTECHGTEIAKQLKDGKKIVPMDYQDGKFIAKQVAIPIVADQLNWQFLDKEGDSWILLKNDKPVHVQNACYGEPLTKQQISKLAMPFKK
jgi:hypothetical protein